MLAPPIELAREQTPPLAARIEHGLAPMRAPQTELQPIVLGPARIRQLAPKQARRIASRSAGR